MGFIIAQLALFPSEIGLRKQAMFVSCARQVGHVENKEYLTGQE